MAGFLFARVVTVALVVLVSLGSSLACSPARDAKGRFTTADLAKLRWIEGTWRGTDESGQGAFFERYRFASDTRIETESFSDAELSQVSGRSATYLQNGEILHENETMLWYATRLTDSAIEFAPRSRATNSFTWEPESADRWTARLTSKDAQGNTKVTTYRMERIRP